MNVSSFSRTPALSVFNWNDIEQTEITNGSGVSTVPEWLQEDLRSFTRFDPWSRRSENASVAHRVAYR